MAYIYVINNVVNGKRYVGSTQNDPKKRRYDQFSSLRRGTNSSRWLQEDFNLYGGDAFSFEVIEHDVPVEDRYVREQYYMDMYQSYDKDLGYNVSPTADRTLGRRHTEDAKRRMSITHTGKKLSYEHRRRISESMKQFRARQREQAQESAEVQAADIAETRAA